MQINYDMEEEEDGENEEEEALGEMDADAERTVNTQDKTAAGSVVGIAAEFMKEDDLDSPLHVLAGALDAAGTGEKWSFVDDLPQGQARSKRPASLQMPPGAQGPKSPYRDSLAALHEIATSPGTFAREQIRQQEQLVESALAYQGITFIGQVEASRIHQNQAALLLHDRPFGSVFAPPLSIPSSNPRGKDQGRRDLSEATKMKVVAEKLEARMGKSNPKVGKTWLTVARMYQNASRGVDQADEEPCKEGAAHALSQALECCRVITQQHSNLSMTPRAQEGFDYLFTRIKKQRQHYHE